MGVLLLLLALFLSLFRLSLTRLAWSGTERDDMKWTHGLTKSYNIVLGALLFFFHRSYNSTLPVRSSQSPGLRVSLSTNCRNDMV